MSSGSPEWSAGQSVLHPEMGAGVFIAAESGGYARIFFQTLGERQVPITSLRRALSWEEQVVAQVRPATPEAVERLWLALEAEQLPLRESAATLTAAKVDLLPHQIAWGAGVRASLDISVAGASVVAVPLMSNEALTPSGLVDTDLRLRTE